MPVKMFNTKLNLKMRTKVNCEVVKNIAGDLMYLKIT